MSAHLAVVPEQPPATRLHISASAVRCLTECPREFFHRYHCGYDREDTPSSMVVGSAVHRAAALLYEALQRDEEPNNAELEAEAIDYLHRELSGPRPVLFGKGETQEALVDECRRLVALFTAEAYRPFKVLGVEMEFRVPPVHPATGEVIPTFEEDILGFFDLVAEDAQGGLMVIDHKTCKRFAPPKVTRGDLQMSLYAYAAEAMFGRPAKVFHQSIVRTKSPRIELTEIPRSPNDTAEAIEDIWSTLELIHLSVTHLSPARLLGRRRSWRCATCGYRQRCASLNGV